MLLVSLLVVEVAHWFSEQKKDLQLNLVNCSILGLGASLGDYGKYFTTVRWALFAGFLLCSCGESPAGPQTADSDRGVIADSRPNKEKGVINPLSVRIAFDPQVAAIEYDRPVRVVLTNKSDQPVRIWNPQTKNGYGAFLFHFADPKSGKENIARRREIKDDGFWTALAQGIKSGSKVIEIPPHGEIPFEFVLSEFAWGDRAWVGLPSPNPDAPYSVSVEFASTDGSQNVWTGSVRSEPVEARFVAAKIKTPHDCLGNGFVEKAIEMMEADPKWITARDNHCTPLHHAVRFGQLEAVQWLLPHGADVNAAYNQSTPLHFADDPTIIRLILEKRPDLTLRDSSGETALQRAASRLADARDENGRKHWRQIVKLYEDAAGGSDLLTATTLGDLDRVKAILSKTPEFADDFQGRSPLRIAASRGHFEICRYLLDGYRVDANDFERGGGYPIIKEALAYPKIVQLLIEHGADLKKRITWRGNRSGVWIVGDDATALHHAAADGVPETIKLLIDSGVDIFATAHELADENNKQTALEVAAFFGKAENAQAIISHPKFDVADSRTKQALLDKCLRIGACTGWIARDSDRAKLMEVLIKNGANPNTSERSHIPIQDPSRGIDLSDEK